MKTVPDFAIQSYCAARLTKPARRLVGELQEGLATRSGYAQRKLRLSFAPLVERPWSGSSGNNSYEHTIDSSNGDGHLPLWWIRR